MQPYYDATDLTLKHVFDCCKLLKPLKGVDVNEQQVQFWYSEFIRMGWKKKDFDKQFEAVKRANLYSPPRIDLNTWLKTEIMYNEIDFSNGIETRIKNILARGNFLKDKKVELSNEDKQAIDLAEAKAVEAKYLANLYEKRETYQEERRKIWEKKFTEAGYAEKMKQCSKCVHNWNNYNDNNAKLGWCYMFEKYMPECKKYEFKPF